MSDLFVTENILPRDRVLSTLRTTILSERHIIRAWQAARGRLTARQMP